MSIRAKLILMLAAPLIALLALLLIGASEKLQKSRNIAQVSHLSSYAGGFGRLIHELQRERGLSSGFLASRGERFAGALDEQRTSTDRVASGLADDLSRSPAGGSSADLTAMLDA